MAAANSSIDPSRPTTSPPKSAPVWPRPRSWPRSMAARSTYAARCRPRAKSASGCSRRKTRSRSPCMRHSAAHVMAQAVMRLFEGVQLAFGPTTGTGFYYDFRLATPTLRRRLPAHRSRDAEDHQGRRAVRATRHAARRSARTLPGAEAGIQGRTHRNRPRRREVAVVLSPGRVHRSLPRPAHSQHRSHRQRRSSCSPSPAPIGRATPIASSCSGSTPPRSSTRKSSTPTSNNWTKPSAAIIACSASSSSCSPSAKPSAPA